MGFARRQKRNFDLGDGFWWLINIILLLSIVFSAFLLVYLKDVSRRDFIDYQHLLSQAASMQVEHNKLLLEESTWASEGRIQAEATAKLQMLMPAQSQMITAGNKVTAPPSSAYELEYE